VKKGIPKFVRGEFLNGGGKVGKKNALGKGRRTCTWGNKNLAVKKKKVRPRLFGKKVVEEESTGEGVEVLSEAVAAEKPTGEMTLGRGGGVVWPRGGGEFDGGKGGGEKGSKDGGEKNDSGGVDVELVGVKKRIVGPTEKNPPPAKKRGGPSEDR